MLTLIQNAASETCGNCGASRHSAKQFVCRPQRSSTGLPVLNVSHAPQRYGRQGRGRGRRGGRGRGERQFSQQEGYGGGAGAPAHSADAAGYPPAGCGEAWLLRGSPGFGPGACLLVVSAL